MADASEKLYFNGINAVTGDYELALSAEELADMVQGIKDKQFLSELQNKSQSEYPLRPDKSPGDLAEAGWGIIFPENSDPAIQEALSELIAWRRDQAQAEEEEYFKIFAGDDGYRQGDTKDSFLSRHGIGPGMVDPERGVPYYLLLVGSPGEIPFDFQYQLDVQFAVGRIYFNTLQEYANYARSVVTAERDGVALPRRVSLFGVANEDDRATALSSQHLVTPLVTTLQKESDKLAKKGTGWKIDPYMAEAATKSQLSDLLNGGQAPALLFTASHGMGFPLGHIEQMPGQGALLCSDWPGPIDHRGPINRDWYFAAEDLSSEANLLGMIGFTFACYGAGTPQRDEFAKPGKTPNEIAPYPFLAALPTKMLGLSKGGALAIVGHVERAWGYSISWSGVTESITSFEVALRQLMKRFPIGYAIEAFDLRYAELATELTMLIDRREKDKYKLTGTWTAHNDARSYVVLGDPAVRLPTAEKDQTPADRPVIQVKSVTGVAPPPLSPQPQSTFNAEPASTEPSPSVTSALTPDANMVFGSLWGGSDTPKADDEPGPLKKFVERLGDFMVKMLDDTTTLEVDTYVSHDLDQVEYQGGKFVGAKLRVATRVTIDGDTKLCVPQDEDGDIDTELWAIHTAAVQQAQASRAELVKTAIEAGTSLFNLFKPG
ncbi:MAG: hypothetical protein KDJ65_08800 [Anaerolineae bacterium]|nr:hypothetical protein [Anaerolineae bacterium]